MTRQDILNIRKALIGEKLTIIYYEYKSYEHALNYNKYLTIEEYYNTIKLNTRTVTIEDIKLVKNNIEDPMEPYNQYYYKEENYFIIYTNYKLTKEEIELREELYVKPMYQQIKISIDKISTLISKKQVTNDYFTPYDPDLGDNYSDYIDYAHMLRYDSDHHKNDSQDLKLILNNNNIKKSKTRKINKHKISKRIANKKPQTPNKPQKKFAFFIVRESKRNEDKSYTNIRTATFRATSIKIAICMALKKFEYKNTDVRNFNYSKGQLYVDGTKQTVPAVYTRLSNGNQLSIFWIPVKNRDNEYIYKIQK